MSMPGWYPDPSGASGRFRFWDGQAWSSETTSDPNQDPPRQGAGVTERASSNAWLIALIALAVVTAVVVFVAVRGGSSTRYTPATADTNSDAPTVQPWDETSTPSPTSQPPTDDAGQLITCPYTTQTGSTKQTGDRMRADALSVQQIPGWDNSNIYLQFAYDLHGQDEIIYNYALGSWMSNISVGLIHHDDGFVDIRTSAEQAMECYASSGYYHAFTGRNDLVSEQITISGRPAWHIRAEIYVEIPQLPHVDGDVTDVIVVDLGPDKNYLGLFLGCHTIGDEARGQLVDQAIASLTVDD